MQINLGEFLHKNQTVAVALSGGSDSMALLDYMLANAEKYSINVIALNVEHGIRGQDSIDDTNFVKNYCDKNNVKLITYTVDCVKKASEEKLSLEQAGRILRYQCFYDAIDKGLCDKVATAHHQKDNVESVLFNLFRGTGIKGVCGIEKNFQDKIIRPFLDVSKSQIEEYIKERKIPFVTDKTNFDDDYSRNYIRLNVTPVIEKAFPDAEKNVAKFISIASLENEYMDEQAQKILQIHDTCAKISIPCHKAIFARAMIKALKTLGVKKDWESVHVESAFALIGNENGAKIDLLKGVTAVREYDHIAFYNKTPKADVIFPFNKGVYSIDGQTVIIEESTPQDLKDGLYGDGAKIPQSAVIRTRRDGDYFTKFGGGTKSLSDYLTDKKVPLRLRDNLVLIADGNDVLVIFGVATSNKIKVDHSTKNILKFTKGK